MELHKKIEKMIFLSNVCQTAILQKSWYNYSSRFNRDSTAIQPFFAVVDMSFEGEAIVANQLYHKYL